MLQAGSSARLEFLPQCWRHAGQPPNTPSALLCRFTHKHNTKRRIGRRWYSSRTVSHRFKHAAVVDSCCSCSASKALQSTLSVPSINILPPSICFGHLTMERRGVRLGKIFPQMKNLMLPLMSPRILARKTSSADLTRVWPHQTAYSACHICQHARHTLF